MARKKGFVSMMALAIGAAALVGSGLPLAAQGAGPGGGQGAGRGAGPNAQARGAMLFDRMDADASGTISPEEFTAQARARFAELDTDGDGALSATEAEALGPANRREAWSGDWDDDRDGRRGEKRGQGWRQSDDRRGPHGHRSGMGQGMGPGYGMGAGQGMGPGMQGGYGMFGGMEGTGPMGYGGFGDPTLSDEDRAARAQSLVEMLDADDDGKLSAEEMASRPGPRMMFDRADADGDGAISRDEFEAAIERFGARRGTR